MKTETKLALSVPEAAKMLGISKATAWEAVWRGEIPSFKIGARRLVSVSALQKWVDDASTQGIECPKQKTPAVG